MPEGLMSVGTFAAKAGVSVRTLHYYEEIGLLKPDLRTGAGHRLYGKSSALRLQQVKSLQALGFSLEEVRGVLAKPDYNPQQVVAKHLAMLREEIERKQDLLQKLQWLQRALTASADLSTSSLGELLEVIAMFEKYYSPEQLQQLAERREALGAQAIRQAEDDWRQLIEAVRDLMDRGHKPQDPEVEPLARKWSELIQQFTGGDAGITTSLAKLYREEGPKPIQAQGFPMNLEMMEFMTRALRLRGLPPNEATDA